MKYFDEILKINQNIMKTNDNHNIRITNLNEVFKQLNDFYHQEFDIDEFIKLCIRLFNMQIFYDGNSRTMLNYLKIVLNRNGYDIDIKKATSGLIRLKAFFPVMYDLNEEISDNEIFKIKQFTKEKKENSKGRK